MTIDLADWGAPAATDVAAAWCSLEERYRQGRYDGAGPEDSVRVVPGPTPVAFTAGHAVTHQRDGARKAADLATGGLADLLAARLGTWSLTTDGRPATDPNYDPTGTFKRELGRHLPDLVAVIDLHGMKNDHGPDVCLGRGAHPPLADPLVTILRCELEASGLVVSVDDPFRADAPTTITSTAQARCVPAVQIELARRVRDPWNDGIVSDLLVSALARAVCRITDWAAHPGR